MLQQTQEGRGQGLTKDASGRGGEEGRRERGKKELEEEKRRLGDGNLEAVGEGMSQSQCSSRRRKGESKDSPRMRAGEEGRRGGEKKGRRN